MWIAVLLCSAAPAQAQIYVDVNATGGDDGTSWSDAYTSLQDALLGAEPGTEVWVARGTYYPDIGARQSDGDRESTFFLPPEVAIYGGFDGTEKQLDERNPDDNVTILSGDLDGDDVGPADDASHQDNAFHVVTGVGLPPETVLDGLTMTAGYADTDGFSAGAGMHNSTGSDPTIMRCRFIGNYALDQGGGLFNDDTSSPTIGMSHFEGNIANFGGGMSNNVDCAAVVSRTVFRNNQALGDFGWGGAIYNLLSDATLHDCTFEQNSATFGGAAYHELSEVEVVRCSFDGNSATARGGGVYSTANMGPFVSCVFSNNSAEFGGAYFGANLSEQLITNSLFHGNSAEFGGAIALDNADPLTVGNTFTANVAGTAGGGFFADNGAQPVMTNTVLWGNTDAGGAGRSAQIAVNAGSNPFVTYSLVRGGWSGAGGTGVIDADPLFRNAALNDFRLIGGSPAIDAGSKSAVPGDVGDVDNDGNTFEVLPLDLAGRPREVDDVATPDTGQGTAPLVDLGAYEFGRRIFVQQDGPGMSLGIAWSDPYHTMVEALNDAATSGGAVSEIWVAAGQYRPVISGSDRTATLQLIDGVEIYGGFAGGETFLFERDVEANDTILTGDLLGDDGPGFTNYADNSFHVVTGSGTAATAVLDGFIVTAGNADGGGLDSRGAGIHINAGSPTIRRCVVGLNSSANNGAGAWTDIGGSPMFIDCLFQANRVTSFGGGGGLYCGGNGSPRAIRCTFLANTAVQVGGGVSLSGSLAGMPVLTHCRVLGNVAATGGGVQVSGPAAQVINTLLSGNFADIGGGLYCAAGAKVDMINSTLANNIASAASGGGAHVVGLSTVLDMRNTLLWNNGGMRGDNQDEDGQVFVESGNVVVNYSLIQNLTGGLGGSGNVAADPLFVNALGDDGTAGTADDDVRPGDGSPAIDAGDTPALPDDPDDLDGDGVTDERLPVDLAGAERTIDDMSTPDTGIPGSPVVDIGGYEHPGGILDCNGNGVADAIDIMMGTSEDCNGNQVPDECDIASCSGPDFPACDDCNLNGVPDSCDIQSAASDDVDMNGVPDECAGFTGGCGPANINWSCVNNWDLGGVFPDNAGGSTYNVTLDDSDHALLDVTVDIDTLRLLDNARLDVTLSGGTGDLTVVQPDGVLIEALLQVAADRAIDVTLGDVVVRDGGLVRADPAAMPGTVSAALTVPRLVVQDGGAVFITDHMSLHVAGDMILEDLPGGPCPNCGGQTPPVTGGSGSGSVLVEGDLIVGGSSDISFDSNTPLELRGDFINQVTDPTGFDFSHGSLVLSGLAQTFEVAGSNVGNALAGFHLDGHANFSMGTIEIIDEALVGDDVTFVNEFANITGSGPCGEALYVHTLIIGSGAHVVLDNVNVYYETLINNGSIEVVGDCSGAIELPSCATDADCADADDCFVDTCNAATGACEYTPSLAACADLDGDGIRDDNCVWHACFGASCGIPIDIVFGDMGGQFGVCAPDGTADGNDRFHALNCFANTAPGLGGGGYPCELAPPAALNVDAGGQFGSCSGDGVCDGNDAFAALNAFDNSTSCSCPLDGGAPAPSGGPHTVGHATLRLTAPRRQVAPGDEITVDVLLTTPLDDLRGYQLHLAAAGGGRGTLDVVDINVRSNRPLKTRQRSVPFVFAGVAAPWIAFNAPGGQMVAGMDSAGIAVEPGYLATYTFKASADARGRFIVELLADPDDDRQRTYLFPTLPWGRITIDPVEPLAIVVDGPR